MLCLRRLFILNGSSQFKYCFCKSKRPLYSSSSLGIDSFIDSRTRTLEAVQDIKKLKNRLKQMCGNTEKSLIFVEDLRKMIGIAKNEEDLELLFNLLKKYSKQKEIVVFQGYKFGPEVMRLLHFMNKPGEALELVQDEDLFPHFQYYTSFLILLDLLFENKKYEDIVRIYEYYQNKVSFNNVPDGCTLIYLGACYKLNTDESFKKAVAAHKLYKDRRPPLRSSLFFAALAVKQNQPMYAIEIFITNKLIGLIENFKYMAYAQAKRFDEVFYSIRNVLNESNLKDFFITNEVIVFIEKEIEKEPSGGYSLQFQTLKGELMGKNLITDKTLDNYLCSEIHIERRPPSRTKYHRYSQGLSSKS